MYSTYLGLFGVDIMRVDCNRQTFDLDAQVIEIPFGDPVALRAVDLPNDGDFHVILSDVQNFTLAQRSWLNINASYFMRLSRERFFEFPDGTRIGVLLRSTVRVQCAGGTKNIGKDIRLSKTNRIDMDSNTIGGHGGTLLCDAGALTVTREITWACTAARTNYNPDVLNLANAVTYRLPIVDIGVLPI